MGRILRALMALLMIVGNLPAVALDCGRQSCCRDGSVAATGAPMNGDVDESAIARSCGCGCSVQPDAPRPQDEPARRSMPSRAADALPAIVTDSLAEPCVATAGAASLDAAVDRPLARLFVLHCALLR